MVCQGLVFTAVCVGGIVWRSSSGLWTMGTQGARTSDLEKLDIAAVPHLSFGSFLAGTHAQEVGDVGFKIFFKLATHDSMPISCDHYALHNIY